MRIGVDAGCWVNGRGYGRFTRELLGAMVALAPADTFVLFGDPGTLEAITLPGPNVRRRAVPLGARPSDAASAAGFRSPADLLRLSLAVAREPLDVFFVPASYTYFPLPPGLRAVVTVHDAIAERFPGLTLPTRRARGFWRAKTWLALRQARLVLTVSDFAAADLARVLGVPPAKLRVAGEAPAPAYRPHPEAEARAAAARAGVPAGACWFMYVGGFNPHKHVDVLLRAHAAVAREAASPPHLLLVGTLDRDVFHAERSALTALVQTLGTEALVHWTGFVADEELARLHSGTLALLLPSACEGYGLPAIEAAACGAAVIATRESPLPALLAEGGVFVPPGEVAPLADAMRLMADEPARRAAMGRRALASASALTWPAAARVAMDALREAAA